MVVCDPFMRFWLRWAASESASNVNQRLETKQRCYVCLLLIAWCCMLHAAKEAWLSYHFKGRARRGQGRGNVLVLRAHPSHVSYFSQLRAL